MKIKKVRNDSKDIIIISVALIVMGVSLFFLFSYEKPISVAFSPPTPALAYSFDNITEIRNGIAKSSVSYQGTVYQGTINGAHYRSNGAPGGSLFFDGNDNINSWYPDIYQELSVSFWFRGVDETGEQMFAGKWNGTGGKIGWFADIAKGGVCGTNGKGIDFYVSEDGWYSNRVYVRECGKTYQDGKWHHFVGVFDPGNSIKMYIDGVSVGSVVGDISSVNGVYFNLIQFTIGSGYGNYKGYIDEFSLYDSVLTQAQVREIYNLASSNINYDYSRVYYPFDRLISSGTATPDETNNNYDASLTGARLVNGLIGNALEFDGDAYVRVDDRVGFYSPKVVSMSAWIKPTSLSKNWQAIAVKGDSPDCGSGSVGCDSREFGMFLNKDRFIQVVFTGDERIGVGQNACSTESNLISIGRWHHVVGVIDALSKKIIIYIDGEESKTCSFITGTGPIKDSTGPLIIGHTPGTAGNAGFEGLIDEVEIYSRILTGQEIADKYGAVRLNKLLEYKFDSISGGITPDSSNSGNEGSIRGASLFEDGISFGALEFDGNDLVESKDVDLGGEFSVSTWIFLENLTSEVNQSFQNILDKNLPGSSSFTSYSLRINDNDKPEFLFRPYGDNVQRSVEGSFALKEAKWYLLTATSGDNALKIYVNGELEDTVATDGLVPFDNNYNLIVGGSKLPTSWNREEHYFHGLIDEVIIYDSALSSGLIGTEYKRAMQLHYRLNDDDDEADDRSSYRRDGDIEGAEWDEDFGADGALEFDGDEDYIEIESFNLGRAFSILAWVNPGRLTSSINQSRQTIVSKGEGRDLIYSLSINDDDKIEFLFEQEGSGGTLYFVSDSKVEVGEWSFAAVTLDEREVKLYFNAELEDSDNIGNKEPENSNDKIFVAVEEDGNDFTNELSGILDEIMFFSRGLSVEEIEDIYDDILDEIEDNQGSVARRTSSNATSTCTPDWSCTLGTCVGEIRTHTCRDLNNCGDLTSIPVRDGQTEPCPTSSSTISEEEESSGVIRYVLIGILVLGIMIISAVLILRMLKNRNSRISGYVSRR